MIKEIHNWWNRKEIEIARLQAEVAAIEEQHIAEEKRLHEERLREAQAAMDELEREAAKSPKEKATDKSLPYINIVQLELDKDNLHQGSFELDWNQFFINDLIKAGYRGKDDQQIIDSWFSDVCKNVALATWEQYDADPDNRKTSPRRTDLGNGKSVIE